MDEKVGLTKDAGWQFGIRRTIPVSLEKVWDYLFSEKCASIWLRDAETEFSTIKTHSHIRTKWKLSHWPNKANLQMRVIPLKDKTTIAFHIDRLQSEQQRKASKIYWTNVISDLIKTLQDDS
jgi:hypothetical protein